VHLVLRSASEAKVRLVAGLRIAFALICMFANELRATLARTIAYTAALAAFALIVLEILGPRHGGVRAANRDWIEVIRPLPAFALTIPEFEGAPRYSIWRHVSGVGRKDVMSFGEAGGPTVRQPARRGLGMSVLERALHGAAGGSTRIEWAPELTLEKRLFLTRP